MDSNSVKALAENSEVISSLINIIPAIIYAGATIFAGFVAIYGISSWIREFRGKRQIELAEDALELFYNTKDAITAVRYPMSYEGEGSTRKTEEKETEAEKKCRDQANVAYERLKEHKETFNKLYAMRYRFMARIGKDKVKPFEQIRKIVIEISVAASTLAELWVQRSEYHSERKQEELQKSIEKSEAIFRCQGSNDAIDKRVDDAIENIEQTCKSIIAKKTPKNNK